MLLLLELVNDVGGGLAGVSLFELDQCCEWGGVARRNLPTMCTCLLFSQFG
jgi:hypothetical protein